MFNETYTTTTNVPIFIIKKAKIAKNVLDKKNFCY